jgi:hypothetical protein
MGIPLSEFPEIGPAWVSEELSKEDIQLKKEEQDEGEWNLEDGAEEPEDEEVDAEGL